MDFIIGYPKTGSGFHCLFSVSFFIVFFPLKYGSFSSLRQLRPMPLADGFAKNGQCFLLRLQEMS